MLTLFPIIHLCIEFIRNIFDEQEANQEKIKSLEHTIKTLQTKNVTLEDQKIHQAIHLESLKKDEKHDAKMLVETEKSIKLDKLNKKYLHKNIQTTQNSTKCKFFN